MIGKIVNGVLITPTENEFKKIVVTNPTETQLKQVMGYKDLIIDEQPPVEDGKILVPTYEETETAIIQHWEVQDIPIEENSAEYTDNSAEISAESEG